MRFQALSLTTPSANVDGAVPATPTDFCFPCDVRYDYSGGASPPSVPAPPTFTGALITCGTGGNHSTLSAAIAAASAGDRIQVLSGTITESALVTVDKSLEIFGTGSACIVQRDANAAVVKITAANVYLHDFAVVNNFVIPDGNGLSQCVDAQTMDRNSYSGVSGIYIASMTFKMPASGVVVSGTSWVVRDCTFEPSPANLLTTRTMRCVFTYGSEGQSFVKGNTFKTTTSEAIVTGVYLNTRQDGTPPIWESGYKGDIIIDGNSFIDGGGAPRSYVDATSMLHQSGPQATEAPNGECNFYLANNNFSLDHRSSAVVIFGRPGATAPRVLSFFGTFFVANNSFGAREASASQKGGVFFTGSGLSNRSMGTLGAFYAANNTVAAQTLPATSVSIMADSSLVMVRDTTPYDAPSPLLTSLPFGGLSGLITVDGVTLLDGYRVFVVSTDPVESGIYSATSGAWYRTSDMAAGDDAAGDRFTVTQGTTYANTNWLCTNSPGNGVVDTDALSFSEYELGPAAPTYPTATGGTETTIIESGITYRVHTFTSSGTFTVTSTGTSGQVQYLVVGGGGAGGPGLANPSRPGCGGNAGQMLTGSTTVTAQAYAITIGDGGVGAYDSSGSASSALGLTATGGVVGASQNGPFAGTGASGGINGLQSSINGSSTYYAGAGGPAQWPPANAAGLGGGGAGAVPDSFGNGGQPGTANTGGGGGGGYGRSDPPSSRRSGGDGGSGIVIIRYPI